MVWKTKWFIIQFGCQNISSVSFSHLKECKSLPRQLNSLQNTPCFTYNYLWWPWLLALEDCFFCELIFQWTGILIFVIASPDLTYDPQSKLLLNLWFATKWHHSTSVFEFLLKICQNYIASKFVCPTEIWKELERWNHWSLDTIHTGHILQEEDFTKTVANLCQVNQENFWEI